MVLVEAVDDGYELLLEISELLDSLSQKLGNRWLGEEAALEQGTFGIEQHRVTVANIRLRSKFVVVVATFGIKDSERKNTLASTGARHGTNFQCGSAGSILVACGLQDPGQKNSALHVCLSFTWTYWITGFLSCRSKIA